MNKDSSNETPQGQFVSVGEAARLLRVSESTIWRWINENLVPSYRIGKKRIYLKREELAPLIRPAHRARADLERLNLFPMSTPRPGVDPVDQALALHAKWREKHGQAARRPEAWEDINQMRDQRTRDLG
jgi:excisionase family DNA binding protein